MISRRDFLLAGSKLGLMAAAASARPGCAFDRVGDLLKSAPKARYWVSTAAGPSSCVKCHPGGVSGKPNPHDPRRPLVRCDLCAQECTIQPGERGKCRVRANVSGELKSLSYGRPMSVHVDPIEKKPFYHFLPGSSAFSLSTSGCPLRCKFCQNWQISQANPEDYDVPFTPPAAVTAAAADRRSPVIAFTYNEPTVFTEYLTDIARSARPQGIRSVMVSCGFMKAEPLSEMCGVLDAIKIDLKGFSEDFYRNVCSAELKPVLRTIKQIASTKRVHLEIVNLVVPTLNDSEPMLRALAEWIAGEAGPDVPLHFTRFHPDYQLLNLPPTPVSTLDRAREIALERGLHYVFVGNVPDHPGNHTYCPGCGKIVIRRSSFFVLEKHLKGGRCEYCNREIAGVWN
jgi:pyruvate formate lyase activating enzyme